MYADGNIVHEPGTDCLKSIADLHALLKWAPPLPERKLLWHCALEKLLDGTRDGSNSMVDDRDRRLKSTAEMHCRIEELETLKDQMHTVGISIVKAVSDGTLSLNCDTHPFPSGNVYS
jgi:hypothetical protein